MRGGRARLVWNGEHLSQNMALAAAKSINGVMADCVGQAKMHHENRAEELGHPHSNADEDYWNQTAELTNSLRIFQFAHAPAVPGWRTHTVISGSWGSDMEHALYVEIGTSLSGLTADQRVAEAHGDADAIPPPTPGNVKMAARHTRFSGMVAGVPTGRDEGFMRPAADRFNRTLAKRVRVEFEKLSAAHPGGHFGGLPDQFFGPYAL